MQKIKMDKNVDTIESYNLEKEIIDIEKDKIKPIK